MSKPSKEELAAMYRREAMATMAGEAEARRAERGADAEDGRWRRESLIELAGRIPAASRPGLGLAQEHEDPRSDLSRAIMARLGPVREALDGHGGGIRIIEVCAATDEEHAAANSRAAGGGAPIRDDLPPSVKAALARAAPPGKWQGALSLVLELDGACLSCGAVPSTLQGIVDDLTSDLEVVRTRFTQATRDLFTELGREYMDRFGTVEFVSPA